MKIRFALPALAIAAATLWTEPALSQPAPDTTLQLAQNVVPGRVDRRGDSDRRDDVRRESRRDDRRREYRRDWADNRWSYRNRCRYFDDCRYPYRDRWGDTGFSFYFGSPAYPRYYPRYRTFNTLPSYGAYSTLPNAHVSWCLDRYQSYNPRTDRYLTYSGAYRRCNSPFD